MLQPVTVWCASCCFIVQYLQQLSYAALNLKKRQKGELHVSEVGLGHSATLTVLGMDLDIQLDVESEGIGMAEVGERRWVLFVVGHRKWLMKEKG